MAEAAREPDGPFGPTRDGRSPFPKQQEPHNFPS